MSVHSVYDRGVKEQNEDALLIKDSLFAVFDGSSSLVDFTNKSGYTGGYIASRIARDVFSRNSAPLNKLAELANEEIGKGMENENIDTKKPENLWSTTAAVIRIKNDQAEYLQVGDSLIVLISRDGLCYPAIPYVDHDLQTMIKWRELANKGTENIRTELTEQVLKVRRELNIKYGTLNGMNKARKFFRTGIIGLGNIQSIILITDGLLFPKEDPRSTMDWNLFESVYQKSGLDGLLKHVRSIEETDPKCWKYPRFSQHDDIAAISIDF